MRAGRMVVVVLVGAAHAVAAGCGRGAVSDRVIATGGGPAAGTGGSSVGPGGLAGAPEGQGGQSGSAGGEGGAASPAGGWAEVSAPPGATGFLVSDAWAVAPDDIIFVGMVSAATLDTPRVLRYAHGVWSTELELPASECWSRPSISGTGADDIWVVASDQIHHRDASGWSRVPDDWQATVPRPSYGPGATLGMTRVRAAGREDVWVLGVRDAEYTGGTGFILHRVNGASTMFVLDDPNSAPLVYYDYDDIYVAGPNDVWVSGGSDAVGSTMDPAFLHHWDGATWTTRGNGRYGLVGIWPTGDGGLWLLEPYDWDVNGVISMARFDGDRFSAVAVEGLPRTTAMTSIWGAAPDDIWAAGETVARWDGRAWRVLDDVPAAARGSDQSTDTFVTGDPAATWLITSGPRFFRKPRAAQP